MRSSCASRKVPLTTRTGTRTRVRYHNPASSQIQLPTSRLYPAIANHDETADSDTSSVHSVQPDETFFERLSALQDMIPASTRRSVSSKANTISSWFKSGLSMGGKTLWVVSTSALLLGVPWALAYSEEQMIVEQERAELQAQRAQNEVRFYLLKEAILLLIQHTACVLST